MIVSTCLPRTLLGFYFAKKNCKNCYNILTISRTRDLMIFLRLKSENSFLTLIQLSYRPPSEDVKWSQSIHNPGQLALLLFLNYIWSAFIWTYALFMEEGCKRLWLALGNEKERFNYITSQYILKKANQSSSLKCHYTDLNKGGLKL